MWHSTRSKKEGRADGYGCESSTRTLHGLTDVCGCVFPDILQFYVKNETIEKKTSAYQEDKDENISSEAQEMNVYSYIMIWG